MNLVYEDEYGAYLGVSAEFLKNFVPKEINPNFEVYNSLDEQNRFIVAKSSRLPDDQDLAEGRYGIDFNRARPELDQAVQQGNELPQALVSMKWLANMAFAATTKEKYERKSSVWENFYFHIWGSNPQIIWAVPHSGSINRKPDDIFPFPKFETDTFTAGVAASCAFNNRKKASKRIMISIHSSNFLMTVLELGGFRIIDEENLVVFLASDNSDYVSGAAIVIDSGWLTT